MRHFFTFCLLITSTVLSGQGLFTKDTLFTVSGDITDCETTIPIKEKMFVTLYCQDGETSKIPIDSNGHYFIDNKVLKRNLKYVLRVINDNGGNYLSSSESLKFNTYDTASIKNVERHFCLVPLVGCGVIKKSQNFILLVPGMYNPDKLNARNTVAKKWGIEYQDCGCRVSEELLEKAKLNNEMVKKSIAKKYGKNWEAKFEKEIDAEYKKESLKKTVLPDDHTNQE